MAAFYYSSLLPHFLLFFLSHHSQLIHLISHPGFRSGLSASLRVLIRHHLRLPHALALDS